MTQSKLDKIVADGKYIVGITGGSGAGKSEARSILSTMGARTIIADQVGHWVIKRGHKSGAYEQVIAHFGEEILGEDGEIDRKKLGAIVFSDKGQLDTLSAIMHPHIAEHIVNEIAEADYNHLFVIDAAVLIESGMHKICNMVVGIFAPPQDRIKRIVKRDNISEEAAKARIDAQTPDDNIKPYVDIEIYNSSTLENLAKQLEVVYKAKFWSDILNKRMIDKIKMWVRLGKEPHTAIMGELAYNIMYQHPLAMRMRHAFAPYILDEGAEVDTEKLLDLVFKNRHNVGNIYSFVNEYISEKLQVIIDTSDTHDFDEAAKQLLKEEMEKFG